MWSFQLQVQIHEFQICASSYAYILQHICHTYVTSDHTSSWSPWRQDPSYRSQYMGTNYLRQELQTHLCVILILYHHGCHLL